MGNSSRRFCQLLGATVMAFVCCVGCLGLEFQTVGGATHFKHTQLDLSYPRAVPADLSLQDAQHKSSTKQYSGISSTSPELDALLGFRNGVTSDPSNALLTWNTTRNLTFCTWSGITCNTLGRVSAINLSNLQLGGVISPSIGNLTFLASLVLANNSFYGSIPPSLGLLKYLQDLDISNNSLMQSIPAEISNCSMLTNLYLSSNHLSGSIPLELGRLSKVTHLNLGRNFLTSSIPPLLGNCSALTYLDLSENNLTGPIPDSLGSLLRLSHLSLSENALTGPIPISMILNCTSLELLEVFDNLLTGNIPPELGLLRNLKGISLFGNHLSGFIPPSLGNISTLEGFGIGGYELDFNPSVPVLTGQIPPSIGRLHNLDFLLIYFSNITGPIPPELGNLTLLTRFFLSHNLLSGIIPPTLGNLRRVEIFTVAFNELVGEIPETLGGLQDAGWLSVQHNQLTGPIPTAFGNFTRMWQLLLSYNYLSGPVIPELWQLVTVQHLGLDNNNFTGELHPSMGNLVNLVELSIARNYISGFIPPSLMLKSTGFNFLNLSNNLLSGHIPSEIGDLAGASWIDLSFNKLSGSIPASIGNCKQLTRLNFSNNQLTGGLPVGALEELRNIRSFNVSNNYLKGPIPESVGAFAHVTAASYAGNQGLCGVLLDKVCPGDQSGVSRSKACEGFSTRCHREWIYIVSGAGGFLLIAITGVLLWMSMKYKKKGDEHIKPMIRLYSVELSVIELTIDDLWIATDSFNRNNILGVGAHSTVYKAVISNHDTRTTMAVKRMSSDPNHVSATKNGDLYHELDILGNLQHRNLVKLHGFCMTPDFGALLIEYVPNGTLDMHLHPSMQEGSPRSCQLSWATRLKIATCVADAMVYLHHECQEPVIHRDLKPSNILLDDEFNAKVGDFGIAKHVRRRIGSTDFTTIGEATVSAVLGSTGYIPPEYATSSKASTRGDVYSYGVVILELLTGRRPVDEAFAKEGTWLSEWVLESVPDRVTKVLDPTLNSELPPYENQILKLMQVGLLCTRDLAKDRPCMRDVREMLEQLIMKA